jgi:signal peptide peptidase SppA
MRFDPNEPMALLPDAANQLIGIIQGKIAKTNETTPKAFGIDAAGGRSADPTQGMIAVIPLWGVLTPSGDDWSYGTSLDDFTRLIGQLDANQNVSTIVINARTPGGTVTGTPEAAAAVRAVRDGGRTKIVTVANGMMASAGVWIGSAASEVIVTPSGEVGSIGVISMYADFSKAYEAMGIKVDVMRVPAKKARFSGVEPMTDEMRATVEGRLETSYTAFKRAMADNRGIRIDSVEGKFGGGEMMSANEALAAGLVDGIATLDETIARLAMGSPKRVPNSARAALAATLL